MAVHSRGIGCTLISLALSLTSLLVPCAASGQTSIGFTAGTEYGLGAVGRVGSPRVMIEVGGGIQPLLILAEYTKFGPFGSSTDTIFKIYGPGQFGGRLILTVREGDNPLRVRAGASHNTILGTGGGGGIEYQVSSSPGVVLTFGILVFPDAEDKIKKQLIKDGEISEETEFSAPLAAFQMALSISVLFGK